MDKMEISMDQTAVKFPQKIFPIIEGEPDYHIIHNTWTLLYDNSSILSTTLWGG